MGDRAGAALALEVLTEDDELVAAEAGDRVRGPQRVLEAPGDVAQEAVAGGVAERVVDELEAVEVHEQHGDVAGLAARAYQGVPEAVEEERAVRQAGEGIVQR